MSFKLEDYEDVASRIKRFRETYDSGRIVVDVISHDFKEGVILVEASIYRYGEDTLPAATDIALGIRDTFNANMRKFYAEDTATSAIGRALGLLLGADKRPTREDMGRVKKIEPVEEKMPDWVNDAESEQVWESQKKERAQAKEENVWDAEELVRDLLGASPVQQEEFCDHGKMTRKEGTSQAGKPYLGFVCPKKVKGCEPVWYRVGSNGQFHRPAHEGDR